MCVARVGTANPAAPRRIDAGCDRRSQFEHALTQMPAVQHETLFALRIDHVELQTGADDLAGVADLPARFAVERRLIEHHRHRLLRVRLRPALRTNDPAR